MQLVFELSGEHDTLPKAEVVACLDALSVPYEEKMFSERLAVIDAQISAESELIDILSKRLGMTHRIYELIGTTRVDEGEIQELVNKVDFDSVMNPEDTFAVRAQFMHKKSVHFKRKGLLATVGDQIKRKGYTVNLEHPSKTFVLLLTAEACLFCLLLRSVDKKQFEDTKPRFRPFFSPGVIMPKISRVLVNLSGVTDKELFIDPFCGTGGILIEAGTIGARIVGMDVQAKMVKGAQENLRFYALAGDLVRGDATKLPLKDKSVDAVVTDLPYGRASYVSGSGSLMNESRSVFLERLYREALDEIHRVLKPGRKAVLVSNFPSFRSLARKHGFHPLAAYTYRVHKSLTRHIVVLEKT